ncbi:MAG TPA: DUF547 domain-containing protein [Burkholderiaceae bacterium]|nr:DUF547 domain-containing protein [Burkholderiaceae bacterium]
MLLLLFSPLLAAAQAFDHGHKAWTALLAQHVRWLPGGHASQVDYKGFARDRAALTAYTRSLSAVTQNDFASWSKPQQLAFLINAYNAFTIEKVLQRYPNLESIRDFGKVFGNPWKDAFFTLLGAPRSLDDIEHGMIRAPGRFDEPRIHVAVVCASIGCPALRPEAYTAATLDAQLEDSMVRFMGDRTRNRYNPADKTAEISRIFDWYAKDFEQGHQGFGSVQQDVLARYAEQLANNSTDRRVLENKQAAIRFLEYDWALNDVKSPGPAQPALR